ncbi:hypothetical protein [Niallia sp. 03190]|uniref:hypothetical protein n=1 Tax=Niallia sp. 03190 TaxID=3458061 RepID=UPI004043AE7E
MEKILLFSMYNQAYIQMIYMSDKGTITHRMIKVLEIKEKYFTTYCYLRNEKRTFKKINILSVDLVRHNRKGA